MAGLSLSLGFIALIAVLVALLLLVLSASVSRRKPKFATLLARLAFVVFLGGVGVAIYSIVGAD